MTRGSLNEKQPSLELLLLLLLLWERMSESVGGEVGAFKPQQVGNSDRFTPPPSCSYTMDLTSCLPENTEQHGNTERQKEPERRSGEGLQLRLF